MFSTSDLHMSIQEAGASPADGLLDVALVSPPSADWTVGLLDVTLQWRILELLIF